ncbi:MAG: efflux RND transporter periplasmic adaptor subunit [bacterium]
MSRAPYSPLHRGQLVPVALALALGFGTAGCAAATDDRVEGTGTVEVDEVNIAALTAGRVLHIWTDEGNMVHRGDTIASLTVTGLAQDVQGRQARVQAAEAQLRDLENGARPAEVARATSELEGAEAEVVRTASDLARVTQLVVRGTVSRQQLDAAKSAASTAVARRDASRSALALIRDGARPQQINAARAQLASAQASLQAGKEATSDLLLMSPADGVVLTRNVNEGEVIGAGIPAVTIGVVSRPWVHVYVGEAALPNIRIGDSATARLDAYPGRTFRGRVVALKDRAEFTPRIALTEKERADLLFAVKVALSDSGGALKPGIPVTVRIHGRLTP